MGIYLFNTETERLVCAFCGDGWDESDLYGCDACGKTMCVECKAYIDNPDLPSEFCEGCTWKGSE